jgi:pimeloyl-ACP methyl ester carboxylesterase
MATRHPHTGRPSVAHSAIELRAFLEFACLPWSLPILLNAPHGDGHPVLLLPGFMGSEVTLIGLELFLRNRGYAVETWGLGRNVGFHARHATVLEQKIRHLHHRTGRKVSLVGWSLGGVFALYAAHQAGECVRSVVTLGSPISQDPEGSASPPFVKAMYRLIAHPMGPAAHTMQPRARKLRQRERLPMPLSCLYSVGDGVVPPQEATVDGDPALHENIRVPGSHIGLGFNAVVLWIVAERLSQPEGAWRRFEPSGALGYVYRKMTHQAVPA